MFRLLLRRLSTAAEGAAAAASPSPPPPLRRPLSNDLYSRISEVGRPHLPLAPVLEQWALEGHTVEKHVVQAIVKKLIGLRRFAHALELSFWMTDRRHLYLSAGDVAYRLELISKVHGLERAVEYFGTVPRQLRKPQCYGSLLKCYGEAKAVEKAEELFAKIQEMGMKSSYAYNVMMKLYLETGHLERVHAMFHDMEEKGVDPDMFSVENLLDAYIAAEDVEGLEKVLKEANPHQKLLSWHGHASAARAFMKAGMQTRAFMALLEAERRITPKNGRVAYSFLLNTYTDLGMYPEVERIWSVYKSKVPPCNSMYLGRISVLLKMGDIKGGEEALKEWEIKCVSYNDFRLTNLMVDAYCREGLVEKAVALVDEAIEKGRTPFANTWYRLAGGFFKTDQVLKAVNMTRKALVSATSPWKPDLTYVLMSLNHFMDQKDVEAAEEMASMVQKLVPLTRDVYHCLLKTYVRAGKPVSDLLERMKKDGLEADEETDRILAGECQ
ncbi:pentatricopeptide repeat-containing protein At2g20710, mitochondrial-like [Phragmites australis]|uniref:pentatricopeptide repeat-containing protein At2g20710, mitochondrial-like n=1 Tax=Phragmites australis TaxID=29695 RepID=UPI002D769416|nr:pentatricopeptide repeat-containing protein At2g20710, mitochondrial-like [Phragmites australis]